MHTGDRFGREDPWDLGTRWPREMEGEAEEGGAEGLGVGGRRRSPSGPSEAGWLVRKLGNCPWPGSAWGPLWELSGEEGPLALGPGPGCPSGGQAENSWPRDTLPRAKGGPLPRPKGGMRPAGSRTQVAGGQQWRWVSSGNPTPTCQPLASAVALGRAPKRRAGASPLGPWHTGRRCGGHAAFSRRWCN